MTKRQSIDLTQRFRLKRIENADSVLPPQSEPEPIPQFGTPQPAEPADSTPTSSRPGTGTRTPPSGVPKLAELHWARHPLPALLKLAWPIVVTMLSASTMTLVDTMFVSRLGAAAIAGVGLAGVLTFNLWCFPMGLVKSVKIPISHAIGAGDRSACHPYLDAALACAVVLGTIFTALGLLLAPFLVHLTETVKSGEYASDYLAIRCLGTLPFLLSVCVNETRQALEDSPSVMYSSLLANALNVVLDYLFIFELKLGVAGAAWASNCSLVCGLLIISTLHAWRTGFRLRQTRRKHLDKLVRLGIPSGIHFAVEVSAFALMVLILSSFSELHTAANQIGIQVLHFSFLPAVALGEAGSVLVGQAVGARRGELINVISRLTLRIALAYATLCGATFFFLAKPITAAFTNEPELTSLVVQLFMFLAAFQFVDTANIIARCLLRGIGDVKYVAVVGIIASWVCTPPLTYFLGCQIGWGVFGAWAGLTGEVAIGATLLWTRLNRAKWRRHASSSAHAKTPAPAAAY